KRSCLRLQDFVATLLEQEPGEISVLLVVLDEQDSRFHESLSTSSGTVTSNVLPLPHSLSTPIRPPISSASRRQIASPRPVPSCLRARPLSTCRNGSNKFSRSAALMPGPVSEMRTLSEGFPVTASQDWHAAVSPISPWS